MPRRRVGVVPQTLAARASLARCLWSQASSLPTATMSRSLTGG